LKKKEGDLVSPFGRPSSCPSSGKGEEKETKLFVLLIGKGGGRKQFNGKKKKGRKRKGEGG